MYELNVKPEDMSKRKAIPIGARFDRLEVVEYQGAGKYGCAVYLVRCDCGTEKQVRGTDLRAGKVVSCGCKKREQCGTLNAIRWNQTEVQNAAKTD